MFFYARDARYAWVLLDDVTGVVACVCVCVTKTHAVWVFSSDYSLLTQRKNDL